MNEKRKEEKPKRFVLSYKRNDGTIEKLRTDMTKDEFVEVMIDYAKKKESSEKVNRELIGISSNIKEVCDAISEASQNDYGVLILGETGTGKEIVASQIHEHSVKANNNKKMVTLSPGGLPESVIDALLFGTKKGIYTDAEDSAGLIEEANDSSLFIDEIGDLPLSTQVKLLRVLESKSFRRLGENKEKKSNFRLICATNQSLETETSTFRRDLYYRIAVKKIRILPLRERRADILPIFLHLVREIYSKVDVAKLRMGWISLYYLIMNEWYGNVRELENRIKHTPIRYGSLSEVINYEPFSLFGGVLTKLRQFRNDQYDISFPVYVKDVSEDEVPGWGFGRINVIDFDKKIQKSSQASGGRLTDLAIEKMLVDEGRKLEAMPECRKQREEYQKEKRKLEEQREQHPPSLLRNLSNLGYPVQGSSKDTILSSLRSSQKLIQPRSADSLDSLAKKGVALKQIEEEYLKRFLSYYPIEKGKKGKSHSCRAKMLGLNPPGLAHKIKKYSLSDSSKKPK
jgi:MoxR-like ATPase